MPTNRPNIKELVEAVREFIENKVQPEIQGKTAFHSRIAVNALKIVERELEHGVRLNREEQARLVKILGQEGDLQDLNNRLCQALQEGDMDYNDPELLSHLRLTAIGKLSIDNPKYSAYQRAIQEGSNTE